MLILLVASSILIVIVLVCIVFISIDRKQRRRESHQLMQRFSEVGAANSLSFSSQEILNRHIIGLDGRHRKLLVLTVLEDGICSGEVVNLDDVKTCCVRRLYGAFDVDEPVHKAIEEHLQQVVLQFELNTHQRPVSVLFYDYTVNYLDECKVLEQRAQDWEIILSKMLKGPPQKRA